MAVAWWSANALQRLVAAVAKRFVLAVLAAAQRYLGGLRNVELHRCEARAFVRAITEWLILGSPAGTPPVGPGGEFEAIRRFLGNFGLIHIIFRASCCLCALVVISRKSGTIQRGIEWGYSGGSAGQQLGSTNCALPSMNYSYLDTTSMHA